MIKSATAVKAKIKNKAGGNSDKSQIMLRIYLMERFLERVSLSKYRDNFVLKGGLLVGSNSKMLSSDVFTQFRDRGDEIRVYPLSFAEFYEVYEGDKRGAWQDYYTYGGMPYLATLSSYEEKGKYLKDLFERAYIRDVIDRNKIKNDTEVLDVLLDALASSIGSLTNPSKLAKTFKSERQISIGSETIDKYIGYFEDSFLIRKAIRYDVKGRKYIGTPAKYYYSDMGLRNARLEFRQMEETHIMENIRESKTSANLA